MLNMGKEKNNVSQYTFKPLLQEDDLQNVTIKSIRNTKSTSRSKVDDVSTRREENKRENPNN